MLRLLARPHAARHCRVRAGRGEVPLSCRVILSSHNFQLTPPAAELQRLARDMHAAGADIVKIATMANDVADSATVLSLLHDPPGGCGARERSGMSESSGTSSKHSGAALHQVCAQLRRAAAAAPTIALAMGEKGVLTRLLAAKYGGFLTFAALSPGQASAPGQPSIESLLSLYNFKVPAGPRGEVPAWCSPGRKQAPCDPVPGDLRQTCAATLLLLSAARVAGPDGIQQGVWHHRQACGPLALAAHPQPRLPARGL